MTVDSEPSNKPVPGGKPTPGVENVPTFDELPPPGYEKARKREIKTLCEEHSMTPQDVERYEKIAEQEEQKKD
ncbi:hypothetical protein A2159_02700 [Candidatus Woesebacteria bacterium RBG_13_34_9]|uniref:Uncharacterized protein n=1 Tax=Candidatus Woesebacteria bacterium RBG_13_34_9 TaxID=1802477 RepID=A0A1F7X0J7_9BACT|nr:MAG: hypothetical protein A2159_02700 [Candidatus Woesebacteria bacterium RBG_13_34_9]